MTTHVISSMTDVIKPGGVLDRIVDAKAIRLEAAKRSRPIDELKTHSVEPAARNRLSRALAAQSRIGIISELKRRSPSKGVIRESYDPVAIAQSYAAAGAAGLSVLTEEDFFDGTLAHLRSVRAALPDIPILRKDFVFDEYQLYESAEAQASAVLLIVAILSDRLLTQLIRGAESIGLDALVEVHTDDEARRAIDAGAKVMGVNNRDLKTFSVDFEASFRIAGYVPEGTILISESGITGRDDVMRLSEAGFKAVLVGEHLMRADDPGEALKGLLP